MILTAKWINTLETEAIVHDVLASVDQQTTRHYLKVVGKKWEIFQVKQNGFVWTVIKNHEQIQDFIIAYNLKFKAWLTFDNFVVEGIQQVCYNMSALAWPVLRLFLETKDGEMGKISSFLIYKKSGGRFKDYFCCRLPWQWQKRCFVITKAGVFYYTDLSKDIKEYLPFSNSFKIFCGIQETGYQFGIRLQANHRKLLLFTPDSNIFFRFVYIIKEALKSLQGALVNSHESFAPVRQGCHVRFLIDGQQYYRSVYEALERAEWQIMICGWWVSPEFHLVRPVSQHPQGRLDLVLQKAAHRGVKIFVLVYNQSSFLTNDSTYTKQIFEKISPNIKVLQHPLGVLPSMWSHHEKVVIVDQCEALMGGLDLCYGRYDTSQHLINYNDPQWYPGIQYNNIRTRDFQKVREFWKQSVSRDTARLPWHDVGVHFSGEVTQDVCHHFIQYWNYASFQTHYEQRYVLILEKDRKKQPLIKRIRRGISNKIESLRNLAGQIKEKLFNSHNNANQQNAIKIKISQPPVNQQLRSQEIKFVLEPKTDLGSECQEYRGQSTIIKPQQSVFQTNKTSRSSKSNDCMIGVQSESNSQNKLSTRLKTVNELNEIVENMEDQIENIGYIDEIRITNAPTHQKLSVIAEEEEFDCQMLRSVGGWSIGCDPYLREQSIHNAYLSLIETAQSFIYIQNQFFLSAVDGDLVIKNQIGQALYERIVRASRQKEAFKVYVLLPLIPGFAGELDFPQAVIPRIIMHWQYHTISRNENSLLRKLMRAGVDPSEHIIFLSLRAHGLVSSVQKYAATQIVYLHSKLMIVDDRRVIIGSANINDRSMRGSRDSELCILVEGKELVETAFGGKKVVVSQEIQKFRLKLWKEHFGEGIDFQDPSQSSCMQNIRMRAHGNTNIYRQIFHCYPDDNIPTLRKLTQWRQQKCDEGLYEQVNGQIKGFVVEFPLQFLKDEDLLVGSTLYPDNLSV